MHLSQEDVQDRVYLAAVCDPVPGRAEAAAKEYGVKASLYPHEYVNKLWVEDPAPGLWVEAWAPVQDLHLNPVAHPPRQDLHRGSLGGRFDGGRHLQVGDGWVKNGDTFTVTRRAGDGAGSRRVRPGRPAC